MYLFLPPCVEFHKSSSEFRILASVSGISEISYTICVCRFVVSRAALVAVVIINVLPCVRDLED